MSEGPIKRERDAWKPPKVSTNDKDRVCMPTDAPMGLSTYCGRGRHKLAASWDDVTCSDCHAAHRADLEAEARA